MDNNPEEKRSVEVDAVTSRINSFSIDYILSSTVAARQQQQGQNELEQMNLINRQRGAQIMAAAAAAAMANNSPNQQDFSQQQTSMPSDAAIQHANPNFIYFMACMLLQQQQQQALQRQQIQQQAALEQQSLRQSTDLTRSPMDSLALLARLSGSQPGSTVGESSCSGNNSRLSTARSPRYQPYPLPSTRPYNTSMMSHVNQNNIGRNHLPIQLLSTRRQSTSLVGNHKCAQQIRKFSNTYNQLSNTSPNSNISPQTIDQNDNRNLKPAHSYIGLIAMCILSTPEKRMVLNDIYQFILDNYPYYHNRGSGWRNSVRHNLSLNECFQKAGRAANGKGHYWTIHPANMEDFMLGDFRRRRAQRKVRRWNNMDVPSDESDDESMEDATKPPLPEHFKRSLEMHRRLQAGYQLPNTGTTTVNLTPRTNQEFVEQI